jgi:arylsulfatase A-like enzyme
MKNFSVSTLLAVIMLSTTLCMSVAGQNKEVAITESENKEADQPFNVLFISVDDLNDWVGIFEGNSQTITPHLDRFAEESLIFKKAYCAAPLCNPSRTAIMTGMYPTSTGVYGNPQSMRDAVPNAVTLPQAFKQSGYSVKGGGKIFHGAWQDSISWHSYFPSFREHRPLDLWPDNFPLSGMKGADQTDFGPIDVAVDDMSDAKVANWAVRELSKKHDKPFFLGVGFFLPHGPWYTPRKYFEKFPINAVKLPKVKTHGPKTLLEEGLWDDAIQAYLASINFADEMVGRVLTALEKSSYRDNTIVVIWSDHGYHQGEHGHWGKYTLWEESTRMPLIIKVPGMTPIGKTCERTVSLIDIYPTLIDLCGIELKSAQKLDGKSLKNLLHNPLSEWNRPALTTKSPGNHSLRSERYHYIVEADGKEQLYDHNDDPDEWTNLASQQEHSDLIQSFRNLIPTKEVKPIRERYQPHLIRWYNHFKNPAYKPPPGFKVNEE